MIKLILFLFLLTPQYGHTYYFSAGTFVPFFNKVQTNTDGGTQKFDINPYLSVGGQFPMSEAHYFSPEFGYSLFLENAKNTKVDIFTLHYNFSYIINATWVFRYGLTNNWYRLTGTGGTVGLNNGNGTTNFPSPSRQVTTYFTTLNFGTEYILTNRRYSIRFDLQSMEFKKLTSNQFNYILTGNFYY